MTEDEMLSELLDSIKAALYEGDLIGHVRAWLDVAEGRVSPDDTVRILEEPAPEVPGDWLAGLALKMAKEEARGLTSTKLAAQAFVSPETARTRLLGLVAAGSLKRVGAKRGTRYLLAEA